MRYKLSISVLLLGMLLLSVNTTYAKSRRTSKGDGQPSFGGKFGVSLNRVHIDNRTYEKIAEWEKTEILSGSILFITGGLTGEYPFSPPFAAVAEVLYERKGAYFPGKMKLQYETINIPISVKYYPGNMEEGFSLQSGFESSFTFSKKYYRLSGDPEERQKEEEIKEEDLTEDEAKYTNHLI